VKSSESKECVACRYAWPVALLALLLAPPEVAADGVDYWLEMSGMEPHRCQVRPMRDQRNCQTEPFGRRHLATH